MPAGAGDYVGAQIRQADKEQTSSAVRSSGDDDAPIVPVVRMGDPLEIRGEGFVVSDEARCRFAIRGGRDADGTERSRFAYSPATVILPETNSTRDPPRGGFGRLTCDAGVFDASDLTIPLDAIVSVAMFGDDFYDEDTGCEPSSSFPCAWRVRRELPVSTASTPR